MIESRQRLVCESGGLSVNGYLGPERRRVPADSNPWTKAAFDELDYGVVVLDGDGEVVLVNHAARLELGATHPLIVGSRIETRLTADARALQEAVHNAQERGLRRLVTLGQGAQSVSISIVPLPSLDTKSTMVLIILAKHDICEELSVQGFARGHGLTPAEQRVLSALCRGSPPSAIASELGVELSTVRTQLGSIRAKTGMPSLRHLVQRVSVLPPVRRTLRVVSG